MNRRRTHGGAVIGSFGGRGGRGPARIDDGSERGRHSDRAPARRRLVDQLGPTSRRQNVSVPDLRHCRLQETGSAEWPEKPHRSSSLN